MSYAPLTEEQAALRDAWGSRLIFHSDGLPFSVYPGKQPYGIQQRNGMTWMCFDTVEEALRSRRWWAVVEAKAWEENAETCHCANCGASDVSDSLLIECQGEPLCPDCRPSDAEPKA